MSTESIVGLVAMMGCLIVTLKLVLFAAAVWGIVAIVTTGIAFWPVFWVAIWAVGVINGFILRARNGKPDIGEIIRDGEKIREGTTK